MKRITPCFVLNCVKTFKFLRPNFPNNDTWAVLKKNDNFVRSFANFVDQSELESSVAPKKKKIHIPRITLLDSEDNMSVMTLENAEKLAKRRNMVLRKLKDIDNITQRPTYKLLTNTEYVDEELSSAVTEEVESLDEPKEQKSKTKSMKNIVISGKINTHDLQIKISQINRLLRKGHTIKVIILSSQEAREDIPRAIEAGIKETGTIDNKILKNSIIYKLSPLPSNSEATKVKNNNTNQSVQ